MSRRRTRGEEVPGFAARLVRRPLARVCIGLLAALVVISVLAPLLLPDVATQNAGDLAEANRGPGQGHILGTDALGRDVVARLAVGAGVTLWGVAQALVTALLIGVPLGLLAGYVGGLLDRIVSALADLTFSTPHVVVILVVLSVFPQSMTAAMVTFGLLSAPILMRVARSATLPVREELYIAAARVSGLSGFNILRHHVMPRVIGPIIVQAALIAAQALIVQTGLAFLRLVVAAPAPSWGGMVADGMASLVSHPWLIWPSGIAIAVTILMIGLLSDQVRDAATEAWSAPVGSHRRRPTRRPPNDGSAPVLSAPIRSSDSLLRVDGLTVSIQDASGLLPLTDRVSFDVRPGETVGIVGESGCGKTVTAMSVLGMLPPHGVVESGAIWFDGDDLSQMSNKELERIRGKQIALVSQEPMISLNPSFRVGFQLAEAVRVHRGVTRAAARAIALDLLRSVRLPDPVGVARKYPFELSGGMAQRVGIARALAGEPHLLIADEPTTALDVTVQAEILDLLMEQRERRGMSMLLVTHDWGVVADSCDRAVVMYAGQVVERADVRPLFDQPRHPYTRALLESNPHGVARTLRLPTIPGTVPRPGDWPEGCRFLDRCPLVTESCAAAAVPIEFVTGDHEARCIHHGALDRQIVHQ